MIVRDLSNSFHPVPKPSQKKAEIEPKKVQKKVQMKKKSEKLAKLEEERYSIITKDLSKCYICKKKKKQDLHEIFGGRNRQVSMKFGLVIPVCRKCHDEIERNKELNDDLHKEGQKAFKKHYKGINFIDVFKKSYL